MPLVSFPFRPGIARDGTEYTAEGTWYDSDKIRFRKGLPEMIGGWRKLVDSTFRGVIRSLFDWSTGAGNKYVSAGSNLKFYVIAGGVPYDVTPIRSTDALGTDPFTTTNGSSEVTVSATSHGAVVNDFVTFSGSAATGGISAGELNSEHQITEIVDGNTFKFEAGETATSNATGGGASVSAEYQINTGLNTFVESTGWGSGPWGSGGWGSSTTFSSGNQLRLWTQDEFGDDLIFCVRGGGVYFWDESSGATTRAVALGDLSGASSAPTAALQIMVSDVDRHVIAFGVNPLGGSEVDPLLVRWSDQENAADWHPTATNSAGGQVLSTGSSIIGAVRTRQEALIFTDSGVESMRFSGSPFVFQFSVISTNVSLVSPAAAVSIAGTVYSMDRDEFYIYNGTMKPLPCTVKDYVFSNLNQDQAYKVYASVNPGFNEVTWFYPVGEGQAEVSRYVTYNYVEGVWSIGTFDRTAWINAASLNNPLAAGYDGDDNNLVYEHEVGDSADGSAITAFIESGDIDLEDGERFMFMRRIIPDFHITESSGAASIDIVMKGRNYPLEDLTTRSTSTVTTSTDQLPVRNRMRQAAMRVESSNAGFWWRLGKVRFDVRPDGRR